MIVKAYKFPLYPTKEQQEQLWRWSRALNDLYNHFLNLQKVRVACKQTILRRFDLHNLIPDLKTKIENLNDVYADTRQDCGDRVATAMILWQRHHNEFPAFRSGYRFFNISYKNFDKSCKLSNNHFMAGKLLSPIKTKVYRPIEGEIKTACIHCDERDRWWLILVSQSDGYDLRTFDLNSVVGLDFGCSDYVATSDGYIIHSPKFLKRMQDAISDIKTRIDKYHKPTGSKKKGTYHESRKCQRLKKTIRRLYGHRTRLMRNFMHTRSHDLASRYDVIVTENLRVKELKESNTKKTAYTKNINRTLSQNSIAMFKSMLAYKSKKYIEVNPAYTSQTCATCGQVRDITLAEQTFKCTSCGANLNRNINAAINIRNLGILQVLHLAVDTRLTVKDVSDQLQMCNTLYPCKALA